MNIRKTFNRLAAGLGLGFAIGCTGATLAQTPVTPIIPSGSTPAYLPRIYERIINGSSSANPAASYIHSPISRITDVPDNNWLRHLQNMSPAAAQEEIRGCFQSFCEHKYPLLTAPEKFIARIIVIEAMFHGGLTDEEFRTYSEFVSRFQPDQNFHQRDDMLIDVITDNIVNSPAYADLKRLIVPAADITAANAREQYDIRKNFIDLVTHEIRSAYNKGAVTTHLDNFPSRLSSAAAYTLNRDHYPDFPTNRALIFNYGAKDTHDIESLLDLTAHEVRHTLDFDDRNHAHKKEISADDVHFKHVAVINLNQNLYIRLCASQKPAAVACPQQYEWYKNQYVERSAQDFARKLLEKFREKVRAAEAFNDALYSASSLEGMRRLEPQKFELPS